MPTGKPAGVPLGELLTSRKSAMLQMAWIE